MSQLAAMLILDRSALAHNIKPLERDGLLTIGVAASDRRIHLVTLTKRGRAKLAEADSLWDKAQQRFERAFGEAAARELRGTLARIMTLDIRTT